jgi:hypothetical protein
MTKEERVVCALSLEEPDRVPLYDLVDNKAIIEHYSGQELTLENAKDVIPAALSRVLDTTRVWMPQALGRRTDERGLTYERRDWWNEWQVTTPFSDLPGASAFVQAEIERLDAWRPQDQQTHLAELLEWKQRFRGTVIPASTAIEAVCDAYNTVGIDQFVYLDAEDPELVRRWVEALHAQTMRRIGSEAGCHVVSPVAWLFNDLGYKGHLIFSPEYLHEHKVFHHIAEICDLYHSYDLKMIFHSDGYITPVVPDLIATEVDALGPIDTPAGMNLAALKAEFGHQVAFVGGIDFAVLSAGSVDDVRRTTLQALADAGPGGGFILGSSSEELYDALPAENIRAMWETTWDAGRYPVGDHLPKTFMATR